MRAITLQFFILFFTIFSLSFVVFAMPITKTQEFNFETGSQAWIGDFTDYPEGQEEFYELAWGWENLPSSSISILNQAMFEKGIFLSGNNHSDDLFMYIKTPISGLKANTPYAVTLSVTLASDAPVGSTGVGGAQGESVHIKVGASTQEPKRILSNGFNILNVDKGNQKEDGKNAVVVGNLTNPLVDPNHPQFAPLKVENFRHPILANSDKNGQLWVFIGTDSGYESTSKYYIGKITVALQEKY